MISFTKSDHKRFAHSTNNVFLHSRPAINRRAPWQHPLKGAESRLQPALYCSPTNFMVGRRWIHSKCQSVPMLCGSI